MATKYLKQLIIAFVTSFGFTASAFVDGPPLRMIDIRAVKDSPEVQTMQDLRKHRTIAVSYMADVSKVARENKPATGIMFVSGLKASIKIEGLKPELNLVGKEFDIVDRKVVTIGSVKASVAGPGYVEFHDLDLRDGAISIVLGDVFDAKKKLPVVTVKPTGWKGVGVSWDESGGFFRATYAHRMDNSAIMPEIRVAQ